MSKSWPLVALGEMLRKSEESVPLDPNTTYREVTIKLWGKGVVLRREASGSEIAAPRRSVVRAGQFILSRIDARNGAFGIVPPALDGAVVSNDFPSFKLNTQRINPEYLGWLSRSADFVDLCKAASEGTTNRVRLKEEKFLAMAIALPPLSEQQRIVTRIDELTVKIDESRGLRRQTVEEAKALLQASASRVFDKLVENTPLRPLSALVTVKGGGTPSKANPFYWQGPVPWISPKDMKSRELFDAIDHVSEEAIANSAAKLIEPGAVLVVVRGMILVHTFPSAILRVPAAINQDMKALIPCAELLTEYLSSLFWAHNSRILNLVEKSTHDTRRLEVSKLLDTKIPVPPIPGQRRIVTYLDNLQAKVDSLKRLQTETAAELDAMLPSILVKAFQGTL